MGKAKVYGYRGTSKPMYGVAWLNYARTCDWCVVTRTVSLTKAALLCTNPRRTEGHCDWHRCPYIQEGKA